MPRRVNLAALLGLIIVAVLSFGLSADAALGEVVGEESEEVGEEYKEMMREAEAADAAYKNALFEGSQLNNEIARTRNDLTAAEEGLEEAQGRLDERASRIYMHGQDGFLGVLLEAEDFREFTNLLGVWMQLIEEDQAEVEQWRESRDELARTEKELEAQLRSWENTREEAVAKQEQARERMDEAQGFLQSQDQEVREEIQEQQSREAELALEHVENLLQEAIQEQQPAGEEAGQAEAAEPAETEQAARSKEGSDQPGQATTGAGEEVETGQASRTENATEDRLSGQAGTVEPVETGQAPQAGELDEETRRVRQAQVARAIADSIREWPAVKQAIKEKSGEETVRETAAANEGTGTNTLQNPVAEKLASAAEKEKEAQEQSRQAVEQVTRERAAQEEAGVLAAEAEKAGLAIELVPEEEKAEARALAEEAERKANLAAGQAVEEKKAAEEIAARATEKQTLADTEKTEAEQIAAEQQPDLGGDPSAAGGAVLDEAGTWVGVPYVYGGESRAGVDCSAFTQLVYEKFGVLLPPSPGAQFGVGIPVSPPAVGDLVFFSEDGSGEITHVGIYNGDGTLTHASNFTMEVSVTPMEYINGYAGARRVI